MSKGWAVDELFNCPEPFTNLSAMGAAWCVDDAVVLVVETDAILIQTPTGSRQRNQWVDPKKVTRNRRAPHSRKQRFHK